MRGMPGGGIPACRCARRKSGDIVTQCELCTKWPKGHKMAPYALRAEGGTHLVGLDIPSAVEAETLVIDLHFKLSGIPDSCDDRGEGGRALCLTTHQLLVVRERTRAPASENQLSAQSSLHTN